MTITVRLSIPDPRLSPNARCHWAQKARAVKKARHAARWIAVEAWQRVAPRHDAPKWERARIDLAAFYKKKNGKGVDRDNLIACHKAAVDGLADAGLIENDNGVEWGVVDIVYGSDDPRIEVTLTELPGPGKE